MSPAVIAKLGAGAETGRAAACEEGPAGAAAAAAEGALAAALPGFVRLKRSSKDFLSLSSSLHLSLPPICVHTSSPSSSYIWPINTDERMKSTHTHPHTFCMKSTVADRMVL